jgi:hypothetical protein
MRGRVMANMGIVTRGLSPLSQTQSGLLSGLVGPAFAAATAGIVLATAAGLTGRLNKVLWGFTLAEAVEEPEDAEDPESSWKAVDDDADLEEAVSPPRSAPVR